MNLPATPAAPAPRKPDHDKLKGAGSRLQAQFTQYERDRRLMELQWMKNLRQFLGRYDPEVEQLIAKDRSHAYPKLTRVKCVSMLSRLMHLLFPTSEKNWTLNPSPVPNLAEEDLAAVLSALQLNANPEQPLDDKLIEMAIMEFARERSRNLEREIEDQLVDIGGSRQLDYVSLCRRVLMSGIVYGMGVLRGPFVRTQTQRTWERDPLTGVIRPRSVEVLRPQYEHVSIWDYYPDMSAKYLHQMDGQFQRHVFAKHQLRELADRDDFFGDVIMDVLKNTQGNYRQRTYESEMRALGGHANVNDQNGRKYEAIVWDGYLDAADLLAAGHEVTARPGEQVEAVVWMVDGTVIKADVNPWRELVPERKVHTYHHFIFEEDESTITGNGLPNIMRDSQMAVSNASRMVMDNGGVVCGPQLELNLALLRQDQDLTSIHGFKNWYRDDDGPNSNIPAVRNVTIESHIDEMMQVISLFRDFADTETFVNPATGGDMSKGPSEPFRTAAGASMLRGDAALPFKDVVRNFDLFTQSVLGSLVAFNASFNPKTSIRGDHQVVPRGATSLIAKEVRGLVLDSLSQTLPPDEQRYLNKYELVREKLAARDVEVGTVLVDKDEAARRDKQAADEAARQQEQTAELLRAEVRKSLAEAVKALTQSDKNAAAADQMQAKMTAELANTTLDTLEGALDDEAGKRPGAEPGADGARAPRAAPQQGRRDGAGAPAVDRSGAGA